MSSKQVRMLVTGRVQGVFYRLNTQKKAVELELTGWVKNLPDGRVEILAEGDELDLLELIEYCKNNPGHSQVEDTYEEWDESKRRYNEFEIRG